MLTSAQVATGKPVPPVKRLRYMDSSDWEQFVLEWQDHLNSNYSKIEKLGGPGDQGRDVVCYENHKDPTAPWDLYQCKFYDHALRPSDVWLEIGKLCFHTFSGAYTIPRAYYFCAPRGVGTALSNLLKRPDDLRAGLISNWTKYCRTSIQSSPVKLVASLREHIYAFNFSILDHLSPMELIEGHRKTPHFAARFGGGLPPRQANPDPPETLMPGEMVYVRELLGAYGEHLQASVESHTELPVSMARHFDRSRRDFFHAESLREFSRDNLPAGEFDGLQDLIFTHVVDVAEGNHKDGFERVKATTREARLLPIDSHALKECINGHDKSGICHQLVNQEKLKWVKK